MYKLHAVIGDKNRKNIPKGVKYPGCIIAKRGVPLPLYGFHNGNCPFLSCLKLSPEVDTDAEMHHQRPAYEKEVKLHLQYRHFSMVHTMKAYKTLV